MADAKSVNQELDEIREQIADYPRPDKDAPVEERREFRTKMNELSKKAGELRKKQIAEDKNFDEKEKEILRLYDKGVQNYAIAKQVYEFVNQDTVGKVVLTIRKAHATDYKQVEDVNSTKGYTGVNR